MSIELRKSKLNNGGMGGGGKKNVHEMKRSRLKPVSKKQRKRNVELKEKKMVILAKQVELYGSPRCEAGVKGWKKGCSGELVLDHVDTRNQVNPDRYSNLEILCSLHNGLKSSVRGLDFRDKAMIEAMVELDAKR